MMNKYQLYLFPMCLFATTGVFPVTQGTTCDLQLDTESMGNCGADGFSAFPTYSCRPCSISTNKEVHIINMYKPVDGTVPINIRANDTHNLSMKLVLASHHIVHWKINKPLSVKISEVLMVGAQSDYSSASLYGGGYLSVTSAAGNFHLLYDSSLMEYVTTRFGSVTSYSAVYRTCRWWLNVGNCDSSQVDRNGPVTVPDLIWTPPDITDCEGRLPCWVKYDFRFLHKPASARCTGDRYVTWYKIEDTTIYFIGAILCTNSRYSLYMSTSLQDEFLYLADSDGWGEDHCELVGMDKQYLPQVKVETEGSSLYGVVGYTRYHWGGAFKVQLNVEQSPVWYECGITIPGAEKIYAEESNGVIDFRYVMIVVVVLVLAIILIICVYRKNKSRMDNENNRSATRDTLPHNHSHIQSNSQRISWVPAPTESAPLAPPVPSAPLGVPGAPPGYEDAMSYPLPPGTTEVETPPPTYASL